MTSAPHSKNPVLKFVSLAYDFFAQYFFLLHAISFGVWGKRAGRKQT